MAIADGYRETKDAWLDLKARGLQARPLLASGDGTMGRWVALEEVCPQTRHQRCWFHKVGNVLNAFAQIAARSGESSALSNLARRNACWGPCRFRSVGRDVFGQISESCQKLTKDRDKLLVFYDFRAEHWQRVRTTNPIESTFATVRHRTKRMRSCVSRATSLGLAFKLIESAEQSWRRIRAPEMLGGIAFKDSVPVTDSTPSQQPLVA